MNWLGQFAIGFLRGGALSLSQQRAAQAYEQQDDWGERVRARGTEGVELVEVGTKTARFEVSHEGRIYPLVLGRQGDAVLFTIASRIMFRPGGLPQDVADTLLERNQNLPRCNYDCIDN